MNDFQNDAHKKVPKSRLARLAKLGGLAGKLSTQALVNSGRNWIQGKPNQWSDWILNPKAMKEVVEQLATLRGAAMKLGQMMAMDAGVILPPQLSELFARLQNQGYTMPPAQLEKVLTANWGPSWRNQFQQFDDTPFAAASIGQVHRAITNNGQELAIKIQYPGVADSIDSDLDNVTSLLRMARLLPPELDIDPLLDEARAQLKHEVDYHREGEYTAKFHTIVEQTPNLAHFRVPQWFPDYSTHALLATEYVYSQSLEAYLTANPDKVNSCFQALFEWLVAEFMEHRMVQTDPNTANYRVDDHGKIVLLDFGGTREYSSEFVGHYRAVIQAAMKNDRDALSDGLATMGFAFTEQNRVILESIYTSIVSPLGSATPYNFGQCPLADELVAMGLDVRNDPTSWHTPPPEVIFLHRKVVGLYLMAKRFKASVDFSPIRQIYFSDV